jgi:hypothetical protein
MHSQKTWMVMSQEFEDAKRTHEISGFAHKVFSLCYVTSFDEVRPPAAGPGHSMQPGNHHPIHSPMHALPRPWPLAERGSERALSVCQG